MSSNAVRQILNRCETTMSLEEIYKLEEELTRIKKIDLTFKGVKVA